METPDRRPGTAPAPGVGYRTPAKGADALKGRGMGTGTCCRLPRERAGPAAAPPGCEVSGIAEVRSWGAPRAPPSTRTRSSGTDPSGLGRRGERGRGGGTTWCRGTEPHPSASRGASAVPGAGTNTRGPCAEPQGQETPQKSRCASQRPRFATSRPGLGTAASKSSPFLQTIPGAELCRPSAAPSPWRH